MAEVRPGARGTCAVCDEEIYFALHQLPGGDEYRWIHVHPERATSAHVPVLDTRWRIDG
jgi:hypothetical protein